MCLGMQFPGHTKRLGNARCCDVIVGGANATRGEHIVKHLPARVHRVDDGALNIRDDPGLGQLNTAFFVQPFRQIGQIGVLCATGKDFVADDNQARGDGFIVARINAHDGLIAA